ncbi:MAG: ATP-binding cassette domain-containing protein [Burkholderiales bacterium]|nr:ATP-binding cassette domain-containing protein [Burkholderiales bacterium]
MELTPVLRAVALTHWVKTGSRTITILDDISLDIHIGESIAIVGASGSGKTTLLALLAGLDVPSAGRIYTNGHDIASMDEDGRARARRDRVGFVFQSFQLLPALTALENVMLPLELAAETDARRRATNILKRVGLADRTEHYPRQLSGGEQQRVAIARAFVIGPAVVFADEPTGNLDARTGEEIIAQMFELNRERGTTLVLVTHDERLAARCQRRIELDAGRIVEELRC